MTFGAGLKRERELRGITLDEISRATKIGVRLLEAIESDRFDVLPEGVFRKSFIRGYAKYLGMNEEQVLQEYALEVQPHSGPVQTQELPTHSASRGRMTSGLRILLILLVVLAGIALVYRFLTNVQNPTPANHAAEARTVSSDPVLPEVPLNDAESANRSNANLSQLSPAATSQTPELQVLGELAKKNDTPEAVPEPNETSNALATSGGSTELTVQATEEVWLHASSDEAILFSGLMKPGESRKFPLDRPLKLILGNAAGVKMGVGGRDFASLGNRGERKALEVSAANYEQYLAKTPQ